MGFEQFFHENLPEIAQEAPKVLGKAFTNSSYDLATFWGRQERTGSRQSRGIPNFTCLGLLMIVPTVKRVICCDRY